MILQVWPLASRLLAISFFLLKITFSYSQEASKVVYDDNGCLRYWVDQEENRIPDFSYAGYRQGDDSIPLIPTVMELDPIDGDNTNHIQDALDQLAERTLSPEGIRGAILLKAGTYPIHGSIRIPADGIVLRGERHESGDLLTTIEGIGNVPAERDLILVGDNPGVNWKNVANDIKADVISDFIPAGSRTLAISDPSIFGVGDRVVVHHPSTTTWLKSIDFGATNTDEPWQEGNLDLLYPRTISAIYPESGKIVLDVPIYDHFNRELATSSVHLWDDAGIVRNAGVEDLQINIITDGPESENHVWTAVKLDGVEDCWVRGIVAKNFSYAAVNMVVANQVTVVDCEGLEPHSEITGARRYNFAVNRQSSNVLFQRCHATYGRHSFVSNGANEASNIVWHDCTSEHDLTSSEGHRRWSQALLFDNITFSNAETGRIVGLYNRGNYGTGHGWSSVHSVAWNLTLPYNGKLVVQKPPGRQNYGIGGQGLILGLGPFIHDPGFIELQRTEPLPSSLYLAQKSQRDQFGSSPDAPAKLEVEGSADSIHLSWLDISAEELGYRIEFSTDEEPTFSVLADVVANSKNYSLPAGSLSNASFRVTTIGAQCEMYSRVVKLETVGTHKLGHEPSTTIWPIPTSSFINLETTKRVNKITITNLQGQHFGYLNNYLLPTRQIDVSNLPAGVYLVNAFYPSGKKETIRFLKQN